MVTVHTDGSCKPNPGPGGWAALLQFSGGEVVLTGNAPQTTNNQMELEAAIAAIEYVSKLGDSCTIDLHTDSEYMRQGITQWIDGWLSRGWQVKNGQPVKNQELWRKLHDLTQVHRVRWHWVRGHIGDPLNERVDWLAHRARRQLRGAVAPPAETLRSGRSAADTAVQQGPRVEIAVGASCIGSTGPGGWAVTLRVGQTCRMLRGHEARTTSNVLLLNAAIAALTALGEPCQVTVYTVSDYLGKGAGEWVKGWQQNQWKTSKGQPVKNRALWEALIEASQPHSISWQVVRGNTMPADLVKAREAAARQVDAKETKHAG